MNSPAGFPLSQPSAKAAHAGKLPAWRAVLLTFALTLLSSAASCSSNATGATATVPGATPSELPSQAASLLPSATATPAPGEVSIWLDWGPQELATLSRIIEGYREMHPGTQFEVVYHPSGSLVSSFETAAEGGTGPSLIFSSSERGGAWAQQDLIRDVSGLILAEHREALHPLAWEQVERGGMITGVPLALEGTVLYRNSALAPEPAETVSELVSTAQRARLRGQPGAIFDLGFRRAAPLLRTCRGELVTDEAVDPVGRPQGLCWLRLLDRLGEAGPVTFDSDEDRAAFLAGQSSWLLDSTEALWELQQGLGPENLNVDPWPLYEPTGENMTGYVWGEVAYFPAAASAEDFEAALSFAIHLLAAENQQLLSEATGVRQVPARREVELVDPSLQAAQAVLHQGQALPGGPEFEAVVRELQTAVRLVVGQGGEPELALELALNEIRQARVPTATSTQTPAPTGTPTPSPTPFPSPPPG